MNRNWLVAVLLAVVAPLGACIGEDEPDRVWNVGVTSSQLVVGNATEAHSDESLLSGDDPRPLDASWYAAPDGIVQLSSDVGATITVTALAPGNVTLYASAGGAQGGEHREVPILVLAP